MKVLMISTDREILSIGTFARARMEKYANALGELHIIVLSCERKVEAPQSGNLWVYSSNSFAPVFYGADAFFRAIRLPRPDVITVQDPFETGILGVLLSWAFLRPLHVQVHTDFLTPAFRRHSFLNRVRIAFAGFTLRLASRIRVVARRIEERIVARYHPHAPISVLPIFVDTAKFESLSHYGHEKFNPMFLVVSRLEKEKRVYFALHALAEVRKKEKSAGLVIVGDGREKQALKEYAERLELSEWVEFVGRADPLPYYAQADFVLVPSEYEGYGLVIIEALAAGIPVVSTDVGIAEDAGALIAPDTEEGFVRAVAGLVAERPLPKSALNGHPYESEAEYIEMWTDDMKATARRSHLDAS